jgi:uncharacterized membrane protein YccC
MFTFLSALGTAFTSRGLIYAFNCTAAALLSLYLAFSFNLPNPWWAALTVFITSQPMAAASGAVVARALYRIAGTVAGVAAALVILPALVDAPELLIAAVSAWVALCTYVSLLDRTPRGYAFMLAGYTLAFVGLPLIADPSAIFDAAVARSEEIAVGAVCAALMHSLVSPRSVSTMMSGKLAATLKDARVWIGNALSPDGTPASEQAARRRLAADLTELNSLALHTGYEAGESMVVAPVALALEERLAGLLPLLAGAEDRIQALAKDGAISDAVSRHVADVRRWIDEGTVEDSAVDRLVESGRRALLAVEDSPPWTEMLTASLIQRLEELVRAWDDSLLLSGAMRDPRQRQDARLRELLARSDGRRLHVDHGLAAYSGLAAGITVALTAALAVATGWPQGIVAVGIAAAGSSVFAFIDDPRPMQRSLLLWTFVSAPVAALYSFAILPAVDGFGALALALLPLFFGTALYLATPRYWLQTLGFALVSQTLIALQPTQGADFTTFMTISVAALVGAIVALTVTSLMRVISAETSSWRILHAGWRELAALASGRSSEAATAWAGRMLDRVALLLPRLARATGDQRLRYADALTDLRLGVNVVDLREIAQNVNLTAATRIERVLHGVATHFGALKRRSHASPDAGLLREIDGAIEQLLKLDAGEVRVRGLAAATGLRRAMFPEAPAYRPEESVA